MISMPVAALVGEARAVGRPGGVAVALVAAGRRARELGVGGRELGRRVTGHLEEREPLVRAVVGGHGEALAVAGELAVAHVAVRDHPGLLRVVARAEVVDRDLAAVAAEDERARVRHPLGVGDAELVAVDRDRGRLGRGRVEGRALDRAAGRRDRARVRDVRVGDLRPVGREGEPDRVGRERPAVAGLRRWRRDRAQRAAVAGHHDDRAGALDGGDRPVVGLRGRVPAAAGGQLHLVGAVRARRTRRCPGRCTRSSQRSPRPAAARAARPAARRIFGSFMAGACRSRLAGALPRPCQRRAPNSAETVTPAVPVGVPRRTARPSSR